MEVEKVMTNNKLRLSRFEDRKAANSMFKMDLNKLKEEMDKPHQWCGRFKAYCELRKDYTDEEIEVMRAEYYSNQS